MNEKIQTTKNLPNFVIIQDGEVVNDQYIETPGALEVASDLVLGGINRAAENVKLQTRMLVFDALHGTHYRRIRHDLIEQEKRRRFEESIGLVAVGKK